MWAPHEIEVEIEEAEQSLVILRVTTPAGSLEMVGSVVRAGKTLLVEGAHIQGMSPGRLGRSGLNAIGRKILVEADVEEMVVTGGTRTTGRAAGRRPRPIRFPR